MLIQLRILFYILRIYNQVSLYGKRPVEKLLVLKT